MVRKRAKVLEDDGVCLCVKVLLDGERHDWVRGDGREATEDGRKRLLLLGDESGATPEDGELVVVVCGGGRLGEGALPRGRRVSELGKTRMGLVAQVQHDCLRKGNRRSAHFRPRSEVR